MGDSKYFSTFAPGDPENPRNWPEYQKWLMLIPIYAIDLSVSWMASGYSPAAADFEKDMGVSGEVGTLGLSLYVLGLAFGPMSLAPLSEYFGRWPIYVFSYGIGLLFLLGSALAPGVGGFLTLRFLNGLFAAVTIANLGGSIADLWPHHETGPAMSIYLWAAVGGSSSGFCLYSFIAQHHGWRIVLWSMFGIHGGLWLLMLVTLRETRHTTILRARAKKSLRHLSSEERENFDKSSAVHHRSARELVQVALARPFRFLTTEAIIIFLSLYHAFLYGLSFLFNGAFVRVFGHSSGGYGFDIQGVGLCFLGIFLGVTIGPITNIWQERHYQRQIGLTTKKPDGEGRATNSNNTDIAHPPNIPESRLAMSLPASLTLPLSLLLFSLTLLFPTISPLPPILTTALFGWSFYILILMSYMYLEDSYGYFSASALAATSLARNIAGAGFPLLGSKFMGSGGRRIGWIMLGCAILAATLGPIPWILRGWGVRLRERSKWAREHMNKVERGDGEDESERSAATAEDVGEETPLLSPPNEST